MFKKTLYKKTQEALLVPDMLDTIKSQLKFKKKYHFWIKRSYFRHVLMMLLSSYISYQVYLNRQNASYGNESTWNPDEVLLLGIASLLLICVFIELTIRTFRRFTLKG